MNLNIIDIESDNLYPYDKNIWDVVIFKPEKETTLVVHPYKDEKAKEKILEFIFDDDEIPIIVGHNILGFDLWSLWRNLEMTPSIKVKHHLCGRECLFLDSLYMSRFLYTDLEFHSLKEWGRKFGEKKTDLRKALIEAELLDENAEDGAEFKFPSDITTDYCIQDTKVCSKLFYKLYNEILSTNQYNQFLLSQWNFWLMCAQSYTGFTFDLEYAKRLKIQIEETMQEFKKVLEPTLPPRPLKKTEQSFYTTPKKPYKKDGSLSGNMLKFFEKTGSKPVTDEFFEFDGKIYKIEPDVLLEVKLPMLLDDQQHMKMWFLEQGWEPTMFNFKKDKKGKIVRDEKFKPIQTSPKLQENGKICPNLLELEGELVKEVVKYLSYKNRYSVLNGWIDNERLNYDGRISASFSGITPTFRIKHTNIVNVPKAQDDVILGKEFRSLFTCSPENVLIGCDQSALEIKCQAHWIKEYDEEGANRAVYGDSHSYTAKAFFPEEIKDFDINSPNFDSSDPKFKPYRNLAKNGAYCLPMTTEILTSNGWKFYKDVEIGETVYSYDAKSDSIQSDIILDKIFLPRERIFKWGHSHMSFECTNNHRWYGNRRTDRIVNGKRKKEWGFFEAKEINSEKNILLSAPYKNTSKILPCEAELIGYILSDGYLAWSKKGNGPSRAKETKKAISCKLYQTTDKFLSDMEKCVQINNLPYNKYRKDTSFGSEGWVLDIKPSRFREFFKRVISEKEEDKHNINWVRWVLKLNYECLQAFVEAFWKGDGIISRGASLDISQNSGNILEGISLAVFMIGRRISITKNSKSKWSEKDNFRVKSLSNRFLTGQKLIKIDKGVQPVFCLTTNRGSFIVRQNNIPMITGNCLAYGGTAKKLATTLKKPISEGNTLYEAFWVANPGLKKLKDFLINQYRQLGFIYAIDGRRLNVRSEHSLINLLIQSTGSIVMEVSLVLFDMEMGEMYLNEKGCPYYLYNEQYVARVGFYHDEFITDSSSNCYQEISKIMENCMEKSGKVLNMNFPLSGTAMTGKNWCETH